MEDANKSDGKTENWQHFKNVVKGCSNKIFNLYINHIEEFEVKIAALSKQIEASKAVNVTILNREKDVHKEYDALKRRHDDLEYKHKTTKKELEKISKRLLTPCENCKIYKSQLEQQATAYKNINDIKDSFIKQIEKQIPQKNVDNITKQQYSMKLQHLESQLIQDYDNISNQISSQKYDVKESDTKTKDISRSRENHEVHSILVSETSKEEVEKEQNKNKTSRQISPLTSSKLKLARGGKRPRLRYTEEPSCESKIPRLEKVGEDIPDNQQPFKKTPLDTAPSHSCPTVLVQDTCNLSIQSPDQRLCSSTCESNGIVSVKKKSKTKIALSRIQKELKDRPAITVPETVHMEYERFSGDSSSDESERSLPKMCQQENKMKSNEASIMKADKENEPMEKSKLQADTISAVKKHVFETPNDKGAGKHGFRLSTETENSEITSPIFGVKLSLAKAHNGSSQSPSLFDSSLEVDNARKREGFCTHNDSLENINSRTGSVESTTKAKNVQLVETTNVTHVGDISNSSPSVLSGKSESRFNVKSSESEKTEFFSEEKSSTGLNQSRNEILLGTKKEPYIIDGDSNSGESTSSQGVVTNKLRRSTRVSRNSSQEQRNAFEVLTRKKIKGVGPLIVEKNVNGPPKKYKQSTLSQAFKPGSKKDNRCEYNGENLIGKSPEEQEQFLIEKALKESLKEQVLQPHQKDKDIYGKDIHVVSVEVHNGAVCIREDQNSNKKNKEALSIENCELDMPQPLITSTPMVRDQRSDTKSAFKKPSSPNKLSTEVARNTTQSVDLDMDGPLTVPHNLSMDPDIRLTEFDSSYINVHNRQADDTESVVSGTKQSQEPIMKSRSNKDQPFVGISGRSKVYADGEESVTSAVFGPSRVQNQDDDGPPRSYSDVFAENAFTGPSYFEPLKDVDDSFDILPQNQHSPTFAHVDVVRKKVERKKLDAFVCKECDKYFSGMGLSEEEKQERMKNCRHKAKYAPPSTPEHYWSINFPDTPECEARGYVTTTQAEPSKARRRKPYKKLFRGKDSVAATLAANGEDSDFSDS